MQLSRFATVITAALALFGTACGVQPRDMDHKDAKAVVEKIIYTKDSRTGLCFAMIATRSYGENYIASITDVPCEKVSDNLLQ